jgi:hypothetical protein
MKKIIATIILSLLASAAFAQGLPVSASAVADEDVSASYAAEVSARTAATDPKDNRRPGPSLSNCCGVPVSAEAHLMASEVSAPKAAEDSSEGFAMAGLGFGLFGLVGVSKLARRKKQK